MNMLKRLALWLAKALVGLAFIFAFCIALIEWFAGCGESYTDSKGKVHINECVFINKPQGIPKP
jgi:hypothetical protein